MTRQRNRLARRQGERTVVRPGLGKRLTPLMPLFLMAGLAGCALLPKPSPVAVWRLQPPAAASAGAAATVSGLRILRPQSDELTDSVQLLVQPPGQPLSVYRDARWSARVPDLVRDYLLDALRRDGRFAGLSSDLERMQARYELAGRLERFQSEYREGQPQVRFSIFLQLVSSADRRVLAERSFDLAQSAASGDVSAVVAAYDTLAQRYAAAVADWLVTEIGALTPSATH